MRSSFAVIYRNNYLMLNAGGLLSLLDKQKTSLLNAHLLRFQAQTSRFKIFSEKSKVAPASG